MKKQPLLTEHANLIPDRSVMWKLSWLEKGTMLSTKIMAETAFEAWRATMQVHHTPFHLVECSQCP